MVSYAWRFTLNDYGVGHRVAANVFYIWEAIRPLLKVGNCACCACCVCVLLSTLHSWDPPCTRLLKMAPNPLFGLQPQGGCLVSVPNDMMYDPRVLIETYERLGVTETLMTGG